ncbi:MAG: hypothetical protein CL609_10330 [Anaerolineaceae bacterium]|nr:hypothetical protein [Anaerolineaceae bacterium]
MNSKLFQQEKRSKNRLLVISWLSTFVILGYLVLISVANLQSKPKQSTENSQSLEITDNGRSNEQLISQGALPVFSIGESFEGIKRNTYLKTEKDPNQRHEVISYVIEKGDSIFAVSNKFNLSPETILWANFESLNDNPELLSIGMTLNIPPTNGIYYKWGMGDTIDTVAARFKVDPSIILLWPENRVDQENQSIGEGSYIMIPGGKREMVSWVMPTIPRKNSGVTKAMAGPGACETDDGAYGTGSFIWPAVNNYLSGNDYWSGHLALDIASNMGSPVFASDSGLVVYAGWNNTGYGNMVMIDHGNGYQSLYAHLSQVSVSCGSSVYQGSAIGSSGSSGNSTGPHLHFETRYLGGLVNPWSLMP